MIGEFNLLLWLSLIPSYFLYEYVGTKNIIATGKLKAVSASNTGVLMYIIGIVGTYLCVTEGLINMVPMLLGSWLGTYFSVKAEVKADKKSKKNETSKIIGVGQSPKENEKSKGRKSKTLKKVQTCSCKS